MCIICNCGSRFETADAFLTSFERSRDAMKVASDAMLAVSKVALNPADKARYDRIHKMMVKMCREWNALEQQREWSGV